MDCGAIAQCILGLYILFREGKEVDEWKQALMDGVWVVSVGPRWEKNQAQLNQLR